MSDAERSVYIDGFQQLIERGTIQRFSATHVLSGPHLEQQFLPWHRQFLFLIEEQFRALGDQRAVGGHDFTCFAMPYWDSADDFGPAPLILASGLGGSGHGFGAAFSPCVPFGGFGLTAYATAQNECLKRLYDAACRYTLPAAFVALIAGNAWYSSFLPLLEAVPHGTPHACIGGNMASVHSSDDPIFYLHHAFVDYVWALWQSVHAYTETEKARDKHAYAGDVQQCLMFEGLDEEYATVSVADTFDLRHRYEARYERGEFWRTAQIEALFEELDADWFVDVERADMDVSESDEFSVLSVHGDLDEYHRGHVRLARQRRHDELYHSVAQRMGEAEERAELIKQWAYEVCVY